MRFLERFSDSQPENRSAEDEELVSIIENLNNILNTKRTYGSPLQDFGIDDFSHFYSREDISRAVMAEVQESIDKYEPRVELVSIEQQSDAGPFRLSYRMDCIVRHNKKSLKLLFDSLWNSFSVDNSET